MTGLNETRETEYCELWKIHLTLSLTLNREKSAASNWIFTAAVNLRRPDCWLSVSYVQKKEKRSTYSVIENSFFISIYLHFRSTYPNFVSIRSFEARFSDFPETRIKVGPFTRAFVLPIFPYNEQKKFVQMFFWGFQSKISYLYD